MLLPCRCDYFKAAALYHIVETDSRWFGGELDCGHQCLAGIGNEVSIQRRLRRPFLDEREGILILVVRMEPATSATRHRPSRVNG
jgi:hypothetical protein